MQQEEDFSYYQNTETQETQNPTQYILAVDPYVQLQLQSMQLQLQSTEHQLCELTKILVSFLKEDCITKVDISQNISSNRQTLSTNKKRLSMILEILSKNTDKTQSPIKKK